jgi:hypothetical protein
MECRQYYVAVFGDPGNPPEKDPVESGRYIPDAQYAPRLKPGDLMLLYCTETYPGFPKQVPGIGETISVDDEAVVIYRWMPLDEPIPKAVLDQNFEPDDARSLRNIRFSTKWLFEISERSFRQTIGDNFPVTV